MTYLIIYINNKSTITLIFFNYKNSVEEESKKILFKILNIL